MNTSPGTPNGCPLPEYPRPQMRRNSYINLNGEWEYAILGTADAPIEYQGSILVPYSPECRLSGVERRVGPEDTLWYRRGFRLPQGFNRGRVLLHFGAVDQCATVYINGAEAGSHTGGYTPFTFDITGLLRENNELVVKVRDCTDSSHHSRGKQKTKRGGIWYTPQSGIWQTVWLESVPREYISSLRITPLYDESAVEILARSASGQDLPCTARVGQVVAQGMTNHPLRISMHGFTAWSPEEPHLYELSVKLGEDLVESYFGMRKFELAPDGSGTMRIFLNGEPCFQSGVLDQGYWPDGLYTPASDECFVKDITAMKELGFNMLRKHIKIEPLRWYYHCDRLGMLVWQDMVNGGGKYSPITVTLPLFTGRHLSDDKYARFARADQEGRAQYERELEQTVAHLYNCVSLCVWVPFNEGWGQFDAARIAKRVRALDPTRLIDHASGWHDQGAGDLYSRHVYFKPFRFRRDDQGRAAVLSEFGGYSYNMKGHRASEREFGYRKIRSMQELTSAFCSLYEEQIIPAVKQGLSAAVYTQLSDVEGEVNGLLTYDREELKLSGDAVRAINARLTGERNGR